MRVTVLVPDIHDLQTGGNIYNRRIVDGMRRDVPVEVVPWNPEEMPPLRLDLPDETVLVVDSLLTRHPDALRDLRNAYSAATLVLLGHYLHCIDPGEQDTEATAAERTLLNDVFDGMVTTSRFARQALIREGVPGSRIGVVPPGLDAAYRTPPSALSARPVPRVLTVANLLPGKGVHTFIEVLRELSGEAWTWTLVGDASLDPGYAQEVHEDLHTAGLAERVTCTGSVPPATLRTWYDRADVFVLPSRFETCSMATREAMARGLPVVGYRVGGLPENFGDASAGHLVPLGDTDAFQAALRTLLIDPMVRAQKGRAARRRSRTFPTWPEAAAQFRTVLEEVQTARPTSPEDDSDEVV